MSLKQRLLCNFKVLYSIIYIKILLKIFKLEKTINTLTRLKKKTICIKSTYKKEYISYLHQKYTKFFNIKKCLTLASSLSYVFYIYGYSADFYVGIRSKEKFTSHAWVEIGDTKYFYEEEKSYTRIISI